VGHSDGQSVLFVVFLLTAPTIAAQMIQTGGLALRDAMGW